MALCRWQTEESLAIYARLNVDNFASMLGRALHADVTSVSSANLPTLSGQETLHQVLAEADQQLRDGVDRLDAVAAA